MDFRKCPACQASVLDDDAEDCPFCGASMSGKPNAGGSKPAAAPPSTPTKSPAAPIEKSKPTSSGRPQSGPQRKSPAESKADDDPFEVDTSAIRKALKLAPKPTNTRDYEVVCPMCDTVGYMQPEDAGKDVQCRNPDCPVPIFKSKRPKVEAPPEEPKKSKTGLIVGAVVVVAIIVGLAVVFMGGGDQPNPGPGPIDIVNFDPNGGTECDNCPPVECENCKPELMTQQELLSQSLVKVVEAARDRARGYNQNEGTKLAAESFALARKVKEAQSEIDRLRKGEPATAYLELQPLAEVAWAQLALGDKAAADAAATEAMSKSQKLPSTVRRSIDSATSVAAALAAVGKHDEANQLMKNQLKDLAGEEFGRRGDASVLWRAALDSGTYDLGLEASRPYHIIIPDPMRMGAIETLISHGFIDEALALVDGADSVVSKDACRAAWAGRASEKDLAKVTTALQSISPAGNARAWAAVASHMKTLGKTAEAQDAFGKAIAASTQFPEPKPENVPSIKQIYESKGDKFVGLTDPAEEESLMLACADIALVSLQFGNAVQATDLMHKAMAYAAATSPGPVWATETYEKADSVKSQLGAVLGIDQNAVRIAHIQYRKQAEELSRVAKEREQYQVVILRTLARAGLLEPVTDFAIEQHQNPSKEKQVLFLDTSLAGYVKILADLANNGALVMKIDSGKSGPIEIDPIDAAIGRVKRQLGQGEWRKAAEIMRSLYNANVAMSARNQTDIEALSLIAEFQKAKKVTETFEFITSLTDPVLRQDAFTLFAAYSVRANKVHAFWDHMKTPAVRDLQPLDLASIYRGFVTELATQPIATTPDQSSGAE